MFTTLLMNALALACGIFIGYQRAKDIYIDYAQDKLTTYWVCKTNVKGALKVVITEPMLAELKIEYEKHKDSPRAVFVFRGESMLVSYAKYLIEFLEDEFEEIKDRNNGKT